MFFHKIVQVTDPSLALSSIRMVKLFGWEGRINEQINERRNEELVYVRKLRFIEMANKIIK